VQRSDFVFGTGGWRATLRFLAGPGGRRAQCEGGTRALGTYSAGERHGGRLRQVYGGARRGGEHWSVRQKWSSAHDLFALEPYLASLLAYTPPPLRLLQVRHHPSPQPPHRRPTSKIHRPNPRRNGAKGRRVGIGIQARTYQQNLRCRPRQGGRRT